MGNCFASDSSQPRNKVFQDFYYLYRDKKYLLRIADDSISKTKFESSIKIRSDSGVGYLNDGRIMVAGGTDNAGCLTNTAYILNPATGQILHISHLPVASKEGAFFHYKTYVYYVGGIIDAEDEEIIAQEQAAPIMKYYIKEGHWEVFIQKHENKIGLHEYLMKKLNNGEEGDEEIEVTMREIIYPGMFMLGSKIYLINGQRMNSKGILTSLSSVFSIDLEEDDFGFQQETFKSPLKVFRPVCGSYGDQAFITGGLKPSSKSCSKKTYLFSLADGEPKFTQISGLKVEVGDTYPVISMTNANIVVSYPNIAIYKTSSAEWLHFAFEETLVNRSEIKYTTPVLEILNFVSDEVVRKEGQYSTKYRTHGKTVNSDQELESGQSLSEPERLEKYTMKLPEGLVLPDGLYMNHEHTSSITSNNRLNLRDSSDDFSVERHIDIPLLRQSYEPKSSESSVNLSDREPVKFKKNIAPMALPAPNIQPKKQSFNFDSEASEKSSERANKAKKVKIPDIQKTASFKDEPEDLSDDSMQIEKYQKEAESDSSDFEINQVVPSPIKIRTEMKEYPKAVNSGEESASPQVKKVEHAAKSSSSSHFDFKPSGNEKEIKNESSDPESSDFDFGETEKAPARDSDRKDSVSSRSKFSLDGSLDKADLHKEVHEPSYEYQKIQKAEVSEEESEEAAKLKAINKRQVKIKESTYAGGLSSDKPKQVIIPKLGEKYVDADFDFESPSNLSALKISGRGKHSNNNSPLKPKVIHLQKASNRLQLDSSRKHNEPEIKEDSGIFEEQSNIIKSKTGFKKKPNQNLEDDSSESFEIAQRMRIPSGHQEDESELEESKSSNIIARKSSRIVMEEPSPHIEIDLSAEKSIDLEYELKKETTVQVIQLITKEFEIESTSSAGLKVLFESYGKVTLINCKLFEDILLRVLPKSRFRVTLLSNVLRKLYIPLGRDKIENEKLLEIYISAGIKEDTTLIDRDVVCFCVSKAIGAIISG